MRKQRYILEKTPIGELGACVNIAGEWHGVWLDNETFFALGSLDVHEIDALSSLPSCLVFPSMADSSLVMDHANALEQKHSAHKGLKAAVKTAVTTPDYLTSHGVTDQDTVAQAGLKIARARQNPHLEP